MSKMKLSNNKDISKIGLGCMQLSFPNPPSEQHSLTLIYQAIDQGVNFFDTAAVYGMERHNEKLIGKALTNYDKNDVFLTTKCGIDFGTMSFTDKPEQIRQSVEESLTNLQVEKIDLLQLHRVNPQATWEEFEETICTMKMLVKEGRARYIGLSEATAEQIKFAHYVEPQDVPISAVEIAYSIAARRPEINGITDICKELNIQIIAYSSNIRGLTDVRLQRITKEDIEQLSEKQLKEKMWQVREIPNLPENEEYKSRGLFEEKNIKNNLTKMLQFQQLANNLGFTPSQLSLIWLHSKGVIPIPATTKLEHLKEITDTINFNISNEALEILEEKLPVVSLLGNPNPKSLKIFDDVSGIDLKYDPKNGKLYQREITESNKVTMQLVRNIALNQTEQSKHHDEIESNVDRDLIGAVRAGKYSDFHDGLLSVSIATLKNNVLHTEVAGERFTTVGSQSVNVNTKYHVGSITKFIIMNIVMQLENEGKFSLISKISDYFLEEDIPNKERITIAELLNHHSGLQDNGFIAYAKDEPLSKLLNPEVIAEPGKKFHYCNSNFVILSKIIEKVTSQTIEEHLTNRVIKPLGLKNTCMLSEKEAYKNFANGFKLNKNTGKLESSSSFGRWGASYIRSTPSDLVSIYKSFFENESYMPKDQRQKVINSCSPVMFSVITDDGMLHEWPAIIGYGLEKHVVKSRGNHMKEETFYGNGGWLDSNATFVIYKLETKETIAVTCSKTQGLDKNLEQNKTLEASSLQSSKPKFLKEVLDNEKQNNFFPWTKKINSAPSINNEQQQGF